MNTIVLSGRLGKDPEERATKSGGRTVRFSLATTRPSRERETDWHNCAILRTEAAAAFAKHAHKGDAITVLGTLQYWRDDADKPRAEIIVDRWEFTPSGGRNNGRDTDAKPASDDQPRDDAPVEGPF